MSDLFDRLPEALDMLTSKGDFLKEISRHNAYDFVVAVADVCAAARLLVEGEPLRICEAHGATAQDGWVICEAHWRLATEENPCRMVVRRMIDLPGENDASD